MTFFFLFSPLPTPLNIQNIGFEIYTEFLNRCQWIEFKGSVNLGGKILHIFHD